MAVPDSCLVPLPAGDSLAWSGENDDEVHTEDTDLWVVLDAEIDVLSDTEAEVALIGEAGLWEFIALNSQALLDDVDGLLATDGDLGCDVLTSTDAETSDC